MGMSFNILPLETFAFVQHQSQPTYQLATANIASVDQHHSLDSSQTQMYISAPALPSDPDVYDTRQEKIQIEMDADHYQLNMHLQDSNMPTSYYNLASNDYQQTLNPQSDSQQTLTVTPVVSPIDRFVSLSYDDTKTLPLNHFSQTSTHIGNGEASLTLDSTYLSVQNLANPSNNPVVQSEPLQLASNAINLIQVPSNLVMANNNLILCLPPEGITLQVQQQQSVNDNVISATPVVSQNGPQVSQNNLVDKAREWLKDSELVNRGLLALDKIK
ncbi:uncharacterized protein LOC141852374 [Brevipalpus obovatus]|uniref:uncharacterized protein LOC141852374 n=1 Tax=Brevipalpus obovatus TaxID=246614 RepID=UPI003D9E2E44